MITHLEQGLASYLASALASPEPTVVARAATSTEEIDRTRPLVHVRVSTEFLPGSETHCKGNVEITVITPAGVGDNTAAKHARIEAAVLAAMSKSHLSAISDAVRAASGFDATGMYWEGFREGSDKQFFQPFLPVVFSFVKRAL